MSEADGAVETPAPVLRLLERDSVEVAPLLLGAVVTSCSQEGEVSVRLTEVEAYRGETDPGSHAYRGQTARNAAMFEAAGAVYVYFTYGMHYCVNLVCGPAGLSRAVLLRAGEVVAGQELARSRRVAARQDRDLARGPARLAQALGLSRQDDGARIGPVGSRLCLALPGPGQVDPALVRQGRAVTRSASRGASGWRQSPASRPTGRRGLAVVPETDVSGRKVAGMAD